MPFPISEPVSNPSAFHQYDPIYQDLIKTLRFLSDAGCKGFDCSPRSLQIITSWKQIKTPPPVSKTTHIHNRPSLQSNPPVSVSKTPAHDLMDNREENETLAAIRENMGNCERCMLHQSRKQIVFGAGNPNAKLMFIGHTPGHADDDSGIPFSGEPGELLAKIIHAIKLTIDDVYLTHLVKCIPPNNRHPMPGEAKSCLMFLKRQIHAVKPNFICTLGHFTAQTLLETTYPLSKLRGKFYDYHGVRLIPTYHPDYLLRYPDHKRETWEDMKMLMREYSS